MSSSHSSSASDGEYTEPRTPTTLPYPDDEQMDASEEEEPSEADPVSPRPVSPTEEPHSIPSFTISRQHPGAPWTTRGPRPRITPRMSVRGSETISFTAPLDDPYQSPLITAKPEQTWLGAILDRWRRKFGNPFANTLESPSQAQTPPCPVTGEPPHLTIPVLVMRLDAQETEIDQVKDNLESLPPPEIIEDLQAEVESQRLTIEELRAQIDQLKKYVMGLPKVTLNVEQMLFDAMGRIDSIDAMSRAQDRTIAVLAQEMARKGI